MVLYYSRGEVLSEGTIKCKECGGGYTEEYEEDGEFLVEARRDLTCPATVEGL